MDRTLCSQSFDDICSTYHIQSDLIPKHVAFIMDGNGRWAKKRAEPRTSGHSQGGEVVRQMARIGATLRIPFLSFYSFSTENWDRPQFEVSFLMDLLVQFFKKYSDEIHTNNLKVKFIGEKKKLPFNVKATIQSIEFLTRKNTGTQLNFMFNYGSRQEIIHACSRFAKDYQKNASLVLNETVFSDYLLTKGIPDPDLLIRTSHELRISNFLLWQLSYSELFFSKTLWPDFTQKHFIDAILDYQKRDRRYGGT